MLRRTHAYKYADAVSMNASFNGKAIEVLDRLGYSIVAGWTESQAVLGGTIKLQASNNFDPVHPGQSGEVWTDITGSLVTVAGTGSYGWNVSDVYYAYVRLAWVSATGQGTVTAWACVKD